MQRSSSLPPRKHFRSEVDVASFGSAELPGSAHLPRSPQGVHEGAKSAGHHQFMQDCEARGSRFMRVDLHTLSKRRRVTELSVRIRSPPKPHSLPIQPLQSRATLEETAIPASCFLQSGSVEDLLFCDERLTPSLQSPPEQPLSFHYRPQGSNSLRVVSGDNGFRPFQPISVSSMSGSADSITNMLFCDEQLPEAALHSAESALDNPFRTLHDADIDDIMQDNEDSLTSTTMQEWDGTLLPVSASTRQGFCSSASSDVAVVPHCATISSTRFRPTRLGTSSAAAVAAGVPSKRKRKIFSSTLESSVDIAVRDWMLDHLHSPQRPNDGDVANLAEQRGCSVDAIHDMVSHIRSTYSHQPKLLLAHVQRRFAAQKWTLRLVKDVIAGWQMMQRRGSPMSEGQARPGDDDDAASDSDGQRADTD
eukprot:TRINITY_DN4951_c0_g1_i1.p1 TRINITY_DN4951_c0_g1~~TRINITY_DN4951_c0_g1_i1.p1  ORF type:complete len:421 (+),score=63.09 TRINITY_DN4951_c0_g1_i1:59-1321(+)